MTFRDNAPAYRMIRTIALLAAVAAFGACTAIDSGPDEQQAQQQMEAAEAEANTQKEQDEAAGDGGSDDAAGFDHADEAEDPQDAYARLVEQMSQQLPADSAGLVEPDPDTARGDVDPDDVAPRTGHSTAPPPHPVTWPGVQPARLGGAAVARPEQSGDAEPRSHEQAPAIDWDELIAGLDREDLLALLMQRLESEADSHMQRAMAAAALGAIDPGFEPDPAVMSQLNASQRRQVRQYRQWLVQLGGRIAEAPGPLDRDQLEALIDEAAGREALQIRTIELCRTVRGFGVYEPLGSSRLPAMRRNAFVVYVEVDRFESTRDGEEYEVELTQAIALYPDKDGGANAEPVWTAGDSRIRDRSRNQRRDFFTVQPVRLPPLPVGRYALKVRVIDEADGSSDVKTIPLHIVSRDNLDGGAGGSTSWPR